MVSPDLHRPRLASGEPGVEAAAEHPVGAVADLPKVWVALSVAVALLSMTACFVGLFAPNSIYGKETSTLADAATAQDIVGLVIVGPLLLVLAVLAARGSLRCWLCWLGLLSFTVYDYTYVCILDQFWSVVLGLGGGVGAGAVRPHRWVFCSGNVK